MWNLKVIPVLKDNYSFVLFHSIEKKALLVDPGEFAPVQNFLNEKNLNLVALLNTHHHWDHISANGEFLSRYPSAQLFCWKGERSISEATHYFEEGSFSLEGLQVQVKNCPGHTQSHVVFYFPELKALFCGDVLFRLGCGRLFEGTAEDLYASLKWIKELDDATRIYCGHEYTQSNLAFVKSKFKGCIDFSELERGLNDLFEKSLPSIPFLLGEEKKWNPFLRFEDSRLLNFVGAQSAVDYLKVLRAEKDSFSA